MKNMERVEIVARIQHLCYAAGIFPSEIMVMSSAALVMKDLRACTPIIELCVSTTGRSKLEQYGDIFEEHIFNLKQFPAFEFMDDDLFPVADQVWMGAIPLADDDKLIEHMRYAHGVPKRSVLRR